MVLKGRFWHFQQANLQAYSTAEGQLTPARGGPVIVRSTNTFTLPTLRGVGVGGLYGSGPRALWHQGLVLWKKTFP